MALDIESIEARAQAATPGPWVRIGDSIGADVKKCTCGSPASVYGHESGCGIDGPLITGAAIPDAEFIAAAREDVPALVAEVERLRALIVRADSHLSLWFHRYRSEDWTPDLANEVYNLIGELREASK